MLFQWKNSYNVGIKEIDDQHRQLFKILDELIMAKKVDSGYGDFFHSLNILIKYAETHFVTEERHMLAHSYPEYDAHQQLHDEFVEKVFILRQKLQEKNEINIREIIDFIKEWIHDHVLHVEDRKFAAFLSSKIAKES